MIRVKIRMAHRARLVIDAIARATSRSRSDTVIDLIMGEVDLSLYRDVAPEYPITAAEVRDAHRQTELWLYSHTAEPFEWLESYSIALGIARGIVIQVLLAPILIPPLPAHGRPVSPYWIRTAVVPDGVVWSPQLSAVLCAARARS